MKNKYIIYFSIGIVGIITIFLFAKKNKINNEVDTSLPIVRAIEAVAALGQLSPSGDIRLLAAPSSGMGGLPRIERLLVNEGDEIKKGQLLAVFDNYSSILADIKINQARLNTLKLKIEAQERDVKRFEYSSAEGASPELLLDQKRDDLEQYLGQKEELIAEINALQIDLFNSELKSPINGVILKVNSREGERPGSDGVLEVGSSQMMEAIIEVYESDIRRVSIGQRVTLTSENGGFSGILNGRVSQISPQVSQRRVLSTDPTGDADARVVEVRIRLEQSSSLKVRRFTGMKVIARFEAL